MERENKIQKCQSLSLVHCLFCMDNFTEHISLEFVVSIVVSESHLRQDQFTELISFLPHVQMTDHSINT